MLPVFFLYFYLLLGLNSQIKGSLRLKMPFVIFFLRLVTNRLLGPKTYLTLLIVSAHADDLRAREWLKNVGFISGVVLEGEHECCDFSSAKKNIQMHKKTACGRPILNVFERFTKRSLRELNDRSIYERTFLIKAIENHAISNELSNVNRAKKHLHKHYRLL